MIHLISISGPDVHGPNRYKVENPAPLDCTNGALTDWGLSGRHVMLDGEVTYVDHVAHPGYGARPDRTLILVTRPRNPERYTMSCKDVDDMIVLRPLYTEDDGVTDFTLNKLCAHLLSLPRNLVRAKLHNLIRRGYAYAYCDDDGVLKGYQLTHKGDQRVEASL